MSADERRIVSALLSADFPGRQDLLLQEEHALVRRIDADGSLEFKANMSPPANVVERIPVEAETDDLDGVTIHLLLHVVHGMLTELEIYREDSKPVQRPPRPESLRVLVP